MLKQKLTIKNKLGLHARAATLLVKLAVEFEAEILIAANGVTADAKSIMDVLMLAATKGTEVQIVIETADEDEAKSAMNKIVLLIDNKFNELE